MFIGALGRVDSLGHFAPILKNDRNESVTTGMTRRDIIAGTKITTLPRQLSAHPEASRSVVGFHAQMNTSEPWPLSTVALLGGISMLWSTCVSTH